ncbi:MAG: polysaccharide deacetylase family protein [Defluviitaleaceae bacterium]|nr:polysaccharide deacetylase family protein [Defluviitaleaceae bacterium]
MILLFKAGPVVAQTKKYKIPIFSVNTQEKLVSLTFNAAWDAADTETILDILEKHGIKASFFLCGSWVEKYPEILKKIYAAGHDIGNHGDTHAHVASISLEANKNEITGLHKKVKHIIGIDMELYRGPYGEYNNTVVTAAESLGYTMIQWDVDSLDWMNRGEQDIINRVLHNKKLKNGSIILFHTDGKYTASVLEQIINGMDGKGYKCVPVSELIYKNDYYIDVEGRQHRNPVQ